MRRKDAERAANQPVDWEGGTVERKRRPVMMTYSTKLPPEVAEPLEAEAGRRGITPSALIRELLEAAVGRLADDPIVTARRSDLVAAIDRVVRPAA